MDFNLPYIGPEEVAAVARALQAPVLRGDGPIGRRVQQQLQAWLGVRHVFFTTSCTHALEMAMSVLGIGPGDEVVMPSFTFVSSANAVVLRGGRPVFADLDPRTLNLDPADLERRITPRTKAVVPMHYGGVSCDMDAILAVARRHGLAVVEDAAQGVDAYYHGRPLGTLGDVGCYSFHDTKNITCGEGGAFLTQDDALARQAELVREKGTNRSAFLRGEVNKYTWVSEGSSYVQSDVLAALLEAQLAKRDEIKARRRRVWEAYYDALRPLAEAEEVVLPVIPEGCASNYHLFFFRVPTPERRHEVLALLQAAGIPAAFHYVPLHSSPFGRKAAGAGPELPATTRCAETLVRLPVYPQLDAEAERVGRDVAQLLQRTASPRRSVHPVSRGGS